MSMLTVRVKLLEQNHLLLLPPLDAPLPTPAFLTEEPVLVTQEQGTTSIDPVLDPIGILGAG